MLKNMIMKRKKIICMLFLLIAIGITGVQAQTSLNVLDKSGKQSAFNLSDIKKIIFNSRIMTINKLDGNIYYFGVNDVRNLNFEGLTSLDENRAESGYLLLYPNPVRDHLQVRYESSSEENITITIINIQGAVVFQQIMKSQAGTNDVNIPVLTFQKGMYLCRIQKGTQIEMRKFIKN